MHVGAHSPPPFSLLYLQANSKKIATCRSRRSEPMCDWKILFVDYVKNWNILVGIFTSTVHVCTTSTTHQTLPQQTLQSAVLPHNSFCLQTGGKSYFLFLGQPQVGCYGFYYGLGFGQSSGEASPPPPLYTPRLRHPCVLYLSLLSLLIQPLNASLCWSCLQCLCPFLSTSLACATSSL